MLLKRIGHLLTSIARENEINYYRQTNIILKLFIQLKSNSCNPLPQSLLKQSTDLGNLGKHTWYWHCMKLMGKTRRYNVT